MEIFGADVLREVEKLLLYRTGHQQGALRRRLKF